MKKALFRIASFVIAAMMLISAVSATSAGIRSSLYLDSYRAWLTPKNNGAINVTIDVQAVDYMDNVGATKVIIYESTDGGSTWAQDKVYVRALYPELLEQDTYLYYNTPITHIGTPGNKYYAIVTVYAGDSTGYDTREYITPIITAKWKGD